MIWVGDPRCSSDSNSIARRIFWHLSFLTLWWGKSFFSSRYLPFESMSSAISRLKCSWGLTVLLRAVGDGVLLVGGVSGEVLDCCGECVSGACCAVSVPSGSGAVCVVLDCVEPRVLGYGSMLGSWALSSPLRSSTSFCSWLYICLNASFSSRSLCTSCFSTSLSARLLLWSSCSFRTSVQRADILSSSSGLDVGVVRLLIRCSSCTCVTSSLENLSFSSFISSAQKGSLLGGSLTSGVESFRSGVELLWKRDSADGLY